MTLHQLKNRQQTLLNLIANVGGKQNIRKWMDELMVIDSQIEEIKEEMLQAIASIAEAVNHVQKDQRVILQGFCERLQAKWDYEAPIRNTTFAGMKTWLKGFNKHLAQQVA
jgi:hypothetical protein